ncbi:DNA adenine methylase [uncultured Corynebacterium sp.]|uniref:DNA adenine methylase n=1 Tax=uncultured Corynebacterium sp. TaxID=159447 RepID=UPI002592A680|nr:DNA adenine methylase [uncultured Corynebacterium sp.]
MTQAQRPLAPILKWVGGKRQLLPEIAKYVPDSYSLYVEPFLGGAAVLLHEQPAQARVNDSNAELINVYKCVKESASELIETLEEHAQRNAEQGSEYYYSVRALDRSEKYRELSDVQRAARILYLNKTCFNGLFRVNSAGQLNVPYGKYKNPNIVNREQIFALEKYLNEAEVDMRCGDYKDCLVDLPQDGFVYLDPPYMPLSQTSSFTGYTQEGFGYQDQAKLRDECFNLREQGIAFLQSNSDCEAIRELYKDFEIHTVSARRSVNSKAAKRGSITEVLIRG